MFYIRSSFIFISLVLFLMACEPPTTIAEADKRQISETCFEKNEGGDRIAISVKIDEASVTGNLIYALKEKDQNSGTFSGVIKGDLMYIQYRFKSRGVESVRDLIFEKKSKSISEKTIELEDGKNTKYISTGIELEKKDCVKDEKSCLTEFGYHWSEADHKCLMQ